MELVKWKQLDDGNITSINGKYYYFNDTAKEILVHLIKTGKPIATVDYISNKYGLSEEESIKWVNAVNRNYDEIDQYYSEVHKLESPLKVQWKITEQCNLRCMHCYNGTTCEKTFDLDKINVIADKICEWDVFEVTLTGGEIFTVPNIQSIMKKLLDRNIKITLFTNGTLIFPYLDFLQKYSSMLHVNISIDGIKEYHDQIRGMGTFDLAIRAIKEMKKRGIKVTTNTVIAKLNYGQMDKLINQLSNYDVNIQFSHLIIKGNAAKNKNVLLMNEEENKKFKNIIIKACSIKPNLKIYYSDNIEEDGKILEINGNKISEMEEDWRCCAGLSRVTIMPNADVLACPFFTEYKLGNLVVDNIDDIWFSEGRKEFLKFSKQYNLGRYCIAYKFGRVLDKNE